MKNVICFFLLALTLPVFAQQPDDLNRIRLKQSIADTKASTLNNKQAIQLHNQSKLSRLNPVSLSLRGAMLFYQNIESPQFQSSCLYERSCSNFSKEAIHRFGFIKGVFLSADRLMRCNHVCENEISYLEDLGNGKYSDEPAKYIYTK